MVERGDHTVFDEPFSQRYYFSCERSSDRFPAARSDATAGALLELIHSAAAQGPVFVKDMAYQADDLLDEHNLSGFTNTYLVRDPLAALSSLERMWPDFTDDEAGYGSLGRAFDLAPGPVLESDDLASDPDGLIRAWCDAVGIDFDPDALSWEPGMIDEWTHWGEWYQGVANSSGFVPPKPGTERREPPSPRVRELLGAARQTYERMVTGRLSAHR